MHKWQWCDKFYAYQRICLREFQESLSHKVLDLLPREDIQQLALLFGEDIPESFDRAERWAKQYEWCIYHNLNLPVYGDGTEEHDIYSGSDHSIKRHRKHQQYKPKRGK